MQTPISRLWRVRRSEQEVHCLARPHAHGFELRIESDDHGVDTIVWRQDFPQYDALVARAQAGLARLSEHGWQTVSDPVVSDGSMPQATFAADAAALPVYSTLLGGAGPNPRCPKCRSENTHALERPRLADVKVTWVCAVCHGAWVQQRWATVVLVALVTAFAASNFI